MNIVVAGGGTAGHVYPALAMADALRERHAAIVTFLGSSDGPESALVPAAGYPFTALRVDVELRAGVNRLLLEVVYGRAGEALHARVLDPDRRLSYAAAK